MAAISVSKPQPEQSGHRYRWLQVLIWAILLAAFSSSPASAHAMPDSGVAVRMHEGRWLLRLTLPFDRLAMALISTGRMADPGRGFVTYPVPDRRAVETYVLDNMRLVGGGGHAWKLKVLSVQQPAANARNWIVDVEGRVPAGEDPRSARLGYDVIIRDVIPDAAIVSVDQDWQGGVLPGHPRVLGKLEGDQRSITVGGAGRTSLAALLSMFGLGMEHIAEGADHIAFLVTLLLTAPLFARNGSWIAERNNRRVLANTVWRVTAFTGGHTLSLLATSLGLLPAAGQGVEVLIALSVAVSAAHALLPIYPRREVWIAAGFGLVHGMAFATAIRELDLSTSQTVMATLGFNVGIELAQLCIVAVVMPLLLLLRGRGAELLVRRLVASAALLAALWWAVSRMLGE
ncbi:HupE/UreJ family protein (plasmid) [Novosphingobium sp. BL-8A]|uniref:HupE/UreJ family protein n=1 Tax=Novosphingobium sp. BL-8A TaxID=3127639 RepID=UPI0037574EBB